MTANEHIESVVCQFDWLRMTRFLAASVLPGLADDERHVFLTLICHADVFGETAWGPLDVARCTDLSLGAINKILERLRQKDLVVCHKVPGPHDYTRHVFSRLDSNQWLWDQYEAMCPTAQGFLARYKAGWEDFWEAHG